MAQDETTESGQDAFRGTPEYDERHVRSSAAALLLPKWPRKSILKHTDAENATVPLAHNKTTEPNQVRPLDRRVSFAEKVQLHKIEISPYLGDNQPSQNSSSDIDDGSSDVDTSFLALEADADKVLTMLEASEGKSEEKDAERAKVIENAPNAFSPSRDFLMDEHTDEDSENSMELTEPLRVESVREIPVTGAEEAAVSDSINMEHKSGEPGVPESETLQSQKENEFHSNEISQNRNAEENIHIGHITSVLGLGPNNPEEDFPYNHQDFGLHHMNDLVSTGNKPQAHIANYAPSLTSSEDFLDGEEEMEFTLQVARFNYEELTMEMTLPQPSDAASISTRSAGFENVVGVFETTMDLTNNGIFPHIINHENENENEEEEEEATMNLTKQMEKVNAPVQKNSEEVTMELTQQVDKRPLQNSEEVTMDITKLVGNDNDHQNAEEVTMDITKPVEPVKLNVGPENVDTSAEAVDEETAMELTQPVSIVLDTEGKSILEGPMASSTQDPENMSPILVESQEAIEETPGQNINTDKGNKLEDVQPNTKSRDADLSTINEEDSDIDSRGDTHYGAIIANAETVQTPTNFEHEDHVVTNLPVENLNQTRTNTSNQVSRNSSSSSLSDDVNMYDDDSPDENSAGKHSLGPAMNPSPTKRHKPSKNETTKENPKPNEPVGISYNDEWNVPDISLPDFLDEIGIKYYDDLEISTNVYQPSSRSSATNYLSVQYYKANILLPLLEVYDLSCKELADKIQQGKILFDEIKEKSLQNNPVLFKRYLSATSYEKALMKTKFHLMKEYTKQQAKEVWYEWRKELLRNIVEVYQKDLEMLRDDKSILESGLESLEESFQTVNQDLDDLRSRLKLFKKFKSNPENLTVERIKSIMSDMTVLNQKLLKLTSLISQKGNSVKALEKSIGDRSNVIQSLKTRIHDTEEEISKTKHFNSKEIEGLEATSQILQAYVWLRFVGNHGHIYDFELDPQIGITVNATKLDTPQGPQCRALESKYSMLRNLSLVPIFVGLANSDLSTAAPNVLGRLERMRELWLKVVAIDRETFQINLRHPLKFHAESSGLIEFEFEYLSLGAKTKIQFTILIPKEKVLVYPVGVSVEAQVLRGEGEKENIIKEALADVAGKFSVFSMFTEI